MKYIRSIFNRPTEVGGFTLVETLVAIVVLLLAIVGPYQIATRSLFAAGLARDQITAYYLAQEPIEYLRNLRDRHGLRAKGTWLNGLSHFISPNKCYIDTFNENTDVCADGLCATPLSYFPTPGVYAYAGVGTQQASPFTRVTQMTQINGNIEYAIAVTVSWSRGSINRSFTIREHIFNWQP